jgi:hypothetical protein
MLPDFMVRETYSVVLYVSAQCEVELLKPHEVRCPNDDPVRDQHPHQTSARRNYSWSSIIFPLRNLNPPKMVR